MRIPALALGVVTGVFGGIRAQDPPAPPQTASSTLLLKVRSPRTTLDTAREVAFELSQRSITVRAQFFDLLARHYRDALREFDAGREKLRRRMNKVVPQTQRELQKDGGAAEIDELRSKALGISRKKDLTKQMIKDEIDPLLDRLRELVLPTPDDVLDFDDKLADQSDELRDEHDTLQGWFDIYDDTRRGLADDEAGAKLLEKHKQLPEPPPVEVIDADIELLCLMALPMSSRDKKALADNDALRAESVPEEFAGTLALNRIRIALGLATLRIDVKLGNASRDHSDDMRRLGFFSHTSPVEGKRTPGQRAAAAGTSGGAENIARGQRTGEGAIRAWWYSPGHHRNMLGGHGRTGLGQSEGFWTQMFGS